MPIYVRAGAIIPFDPIRQYTGQPVTQPTTLQIYPGADGDFTLYEDDGISQAYLHGKFTRIHLTWDDHAHTLTLSPDSPASQPIQQTFILALMTATTRKTIHYDGRQISFKL